MFFKKNIKQTFDRLSSNLQQSIRNNYDLIRSQESEIENQKLMLGKLLSNQVKAMKDVKTIHDVEFKVFSQWGDDGIIQYLINNIIIPNKTFVEFGVEDYYEANTRFLLMNDNWRGLIMDGSVENMETVRKKSYYWKYDLQAISAFIDVENVTGLIARSNFNQELGLLHIDIDGNDYWVWKAVNSINPIIVIVEYNSVFGIEHPWTIPYDPKFFRTNAHYSNLYYGSSLLSLCDLAEEKGYHFVGCNMAGNNAYFVRKDKIGSLKILKAKDGYVASNFAESRNESGKLRYLRGESRLESLKGLQVFNTRKGVLETL